MNNSLIIIPKLLLASLVSFGNISCPDVPQESKFKLPNRKAPETTTPGGSRTDGQCFFNAKQPTLTPLIPDNNVGLTLLQHPTIFVHVPATSSGQAFFSFQNQNGDLHYQTTLSLPKSSGVISISLPEIAPPLIINTKYQWSLVLICGQQLEPDDPQVTGWIQRVEPVAQLQELEISHESVCLLSQQGIWYDLLHHLAQLRKAQPDNPFLVEHWEQLLILKGLEKIATQPLFH
jgi:hypothetical protein